MADCCKTHSLAEMKILDCPMKSPPDFLQAKNPEMLADRQRRHFRHRVEIEAAKEVKEELTYEQEFQERINKMNAYREKERRSDEAFIKRKQVQQYINNCDEIRLHLKNVLLKDSKQCQVEQIKDNQLRQKELSDFNKIWRDIENRDHNAKLEQERILRDCRKERGFSVGEYLKEQILLNQDKKLVKYDELNDENKKLNKIKLEDAEVKINEKRREIEKKVKTYEELQMQIRNNEEFRKQQISKNLKIDQLFDEANRKEIERINTQKNLEDETRQRDIFQYLEDVKEIKLKNELAEREKQKLTDDVSNKAQQESIIQRDNDRARAYLVNLEARRGQEKQIQQREKLRQEERAEHKEYGDWVDRDVEDHRMLEVVVARRQKVAAEKYRKFLLEQINEEGVRKKREKQELEDSLLKIKLEREHMEAVGREFVDSYVDVLPIHPNLRMIEKYNSNYV